MRQYDFTKQPSILIQGAMDVETEYLIEALEERELVAIGNWKFYTGFLGKHHTPVIISKTFQGMVNAAAVTSLAMVHFSPKAVINQGIGGGHEASFHVGDIVLGEKVVPMGAMMRPYAAKGAGIGDADFDPLELEVYNKKIGSAEKVIDFACDEKLLKAAERTAIYYQMEENLPAASCRRIARGVLGSADEWNNQLDRIAMIHERYHTAEEDMESAAVAQLCYSYGVPFIGIRIISNTVVNDEAFDESVALDGQKFVVRYIETLSEIA